MRLISRQRVLLVIVLLAAFMVEAPATRSQQAATDQAAESSPNPATRDGDSPVTPENVGDALFFHHRYEKAIEAYKKAPRSSSRVWNKIGICYEMLLDLKNAERCYRESLRLNRRDDRVWNNLGSVYDAMQDHTRAERQYRQALKINPKSAVTLRNLGTNLIFQNQFEQGQQLYKRALALDCTVFDSDIDIPVTTSTASVHQLGAMNYYKAKDYAQAGMTSQAIKSLRKALNEGFTTPEEIAQDSSFAPLHSDPAFQRLIAEQQK